MNTHLGREVTTVTRARASYITVLVRRDASVTLLHLQKKKTQAQNEGHKCTCLHKMLRMRS